MRRRGRGDGSVRVTIGDVAALAGVSTATVSRALTRPDMVSGPRAVRVQAAAARLGYMPNPAARALASLRTGLVGVLVSILDEHRHALALPVIQSRLDAAGYAALVAVTGAGADEVAAATRRMAAREVYGLLFLGCGAPRGLEALLRTPRVAQVVCDGGEGVRDGTEAGSSGARCGIDYELAGAMVGHYLAGLGHRRAAALGVGTADRRTARFLDGARAGFLAAGGRQWMPAPAGRALPHALGDWLAAPAPPTAIVCGDDLTALAALRACNAAAAVSGRISVVGCGDDPFARLATPALTTVRVPMVDLAHFAVATLLAAMAGNAPPAAGRLGCKLIVRQSTGPGPEV